ncbi:flavin reductase family protein [Christensenellaceae bacterium OttesenSCG-928-L17]|nr:flavin reductase family protein [Christensenellaceae bacterium OttesenSCG-928-L17]
MDKAYQELMGLAIGQLYKGGAFLMTGKEEKNPMTIGWCQFGRIWNETCCTVYVRPCRYSHGLLERDGVFTVCFPTDDSMKQALGFCGTKSGRDVDKCKELNLTTIPNAAGGIDALAGNFIRVECKVMGKAEFEKGLVEHDPALRDRYYNPDNRVGEDSDLHTVYYGKILFMEQYGA